MNIPETQYSYTRESRKVVFDYCSGFSPGDFVKQVDHFGRGGSIRNLHVHTANIYIFWLVNFAQNVSEPYFDPNDVNTPHQVDMIFQQVDHHVWQFLKKFDSQWDTTLSNKVPGRDLVKQASPLLLFTHAITHEFHHKGQIMTMGRILGYEPPDSDVLRF